MADVRHPMRALASGAARDGRAVLVTVAAARGSVPREAGTAMLVTRSTIAGTIGGGHLEFEAIRMARAALDAVSIVVPWLVRFPLAARLGQCCGGVVTLAFHVVASEPTSWLDAALAAESDATPFALVTSLPGGDRLVVTGEHVTGSLGTIDLDAEAVALARTLLERGAGAAVVEARCAPGATLLVHAIVPDDFTVLVFGNGHVGRALVQMLAALPADVRWIDARDADFPASVPTAVQIVATDAPEDELATAPRGACVVIATHDHALDFTLVRAALKRDDWRYLGLIGSQSKRQQFERRLAARDRDEAAAFARVVCPIGRSGGFAPSGKAPGTIALAVAAEIVAYRDAAASAHVDQDATAARTGRMR